MRKSKNQTILGEKIGIVAALTEDIKSAASGVIVNYQGITVESDTAMRKALREAGVKYVVVKNTMTSLACKEAGYQAISTDTCLKGMTAIATSPKDPVIPAKILKEYADKVSSFEILAGFIDGEVLDVNGVNALAEIPSKEALIAKLLGSIQSPLYNLAYALQAVVDKNNTAESEATPA